MVVFLYILFGLLFFCLLLLCLPVTVTAGYHDAFFAQIRYLFFSFVPGEEKKNTTARRKEKKPSSDHHKKGLAFFNEIFQKNPLPDAISELCALLRLAIEKAGAILRRASMRRFSLQITHYNADAAAAAVEYGQICAVVYPFLGFLNSILPFKKQNVAIWCDYNGGKSDFQLDFKLRLIPILCVGSLIAFVFDYIKNKGR